jgi:hypothetical protein
LDPVLEQLIYYVVTAVVGIVVGKFVTDLRYQKGKKILAQLRQLVDHVDDMVYDDKFTEEEFRGGWEHIKGLVDAIVK